MKSFNYVVEIFNNGDMQKVEDWLHEEFLFIKDYGMQNKEEYLAEFQDLFEKNFKFQNPKLVVENEDILVLNHTVSDDTGQKFRVTAVIFLKDGKGWRIATNRTPI